MSQLYLHCGACQANYEDLAKIETPKATATWQPIAHTDIVDTLLEESSRINFKVISQAFGLSRSGNQMFGVLNFESSSVDYGYSIGFRNSHDKSWAAGICAGHRVFVCDNLALSGEYIEKRKHTVNHGFLGTVREIMNIMPLKMEQLTNNLNRLKTELISDDRAKLLIFKAFELNAISSAKIGQVWQEYQKPAFQEFDEPTKFNLLMAFTEVYKRETTISALERMYARTAPIFELATP
jgi:hypothetical protein